jgi:hypothetical protein
VYKVVVVAGEGKKQNSLSRPPEIFQLLQLVRDEKVHCQLKLLIIFLRIELKYLSFRYGNPEMFTNAKNTVDNGSCARVDQFFNYAPKTPSDNYFLINKLPRYLISSPGQVPGFHPDRRNLCQGEFRGCIEFVVLTIRDLLSILFIHEQIL